MLPGALARLKATHPDIKVRLQQGRTEDLLPLLASGELDLIVGRLYAPAVPDGFSREPLWTEPISVLARADHPVFSGAGYGRGASPVRPGPAHRQPAGRAGDRAPALALLGLRRRASLRSSSYGFIREMLLATDLLSVMPRLMMVGDLLRGTLRVVPLPIPAPPTAGRADPAARTLALCRRRRAFIECLRDPSPRSRSAASRI